MLDKGCSVDVVQDDAGWHVRVRGVAISTHGCEDEAVGKAAEVAQSSKSTLPATASDPSAGSRR